MAKKSKWVDHAKLDRHFLRFYPSFLAEFSTKGGRVAYVDGEQVEVKLAYVCPLCMTNVALVYNEGLLLCTSEFTEDHYPPESIGGSRKLLVCRPCNSIAGHSFEADAAKALLFSDFTKRSPESFVQSKVQVSGVQGRYTSQLLRNKKGQLVLSPNTPPNSPLSTWLKAPEETDRELTISFSAPDFKLFHKALLKAAYLYCFYIWGYSFSSSSQAAKLRLVLFANEEYSFKNVVLFHETPPTNVELKGLFLLGHNKEVLAFTVNFYVRPAPKTAAKLFSVVIPGADEECWERLGRLQDVQGATATYTLTKVTEHCLDVGEYDGYTKSWELRKTLNL